MSHNSNSHPPTVLKHIKKKAKQDSEQNSRHTYRPINPVALEPRRDLPLNKIPELLAKITGTLSSDTKQITSSNDHHEELFKHYSDKNQFIAIDGILRFCNDLSIQPDSYELLLFCFLCQAKQMYILTKTEFLCGVKTLNNEFKNLFDLRTSLLTYKISPYEKEFYIWTYHYGLMDGQHRVTRQNAISLWRLFYSKDIPKPKILDLWLNYLENNINDEIPKTITLDTWKIFPQFADFIQLNGYESYDDSEAWPCLFDSFIEYYQKTSFLST